MAVGNGGGTRGGGDVGSDGGGRTGPLERRPGRTLPVRCGVAARPELLLPVLGFPLLRPEGAELLENE